MTAKRSKHGERGRGRVRLFKVGLVLVLSVLAGILAGILAHGSPRPSVRRVGMLVVSHRSDTAMEARAQAMATRLARVRDEAGLSEKSVPVLMYHVDIPAEKRYCEQKLGITTGDLLFVGVVEEADLVPLKVVYRIDRVQRDREDARVVWSRLLREAGSAAAKPAARREVVLFSDTFSRPDAGCCDLGTNDNGLGGTRTFGYIPIFPAGGRDVTHPVGASIVDGALRNNGLDLGGVQVANASGCTLFRSFGVAQPQDLVIEADVVVPGSGTGRTLAGLYVRSRSANVGDGIIGGESSGYWVRLWSHGLVDVFNLHSLAGPNPFAEAMPPAGFDGNVPHHLRASFRGDHLVVDLDGRRLVFRRLGEGVESATVRLPGTGGNNHGTIGVGFASQPRGSMGGQQVDNLVVRARL